MPKAHEKHAKLTRPTYGEFHRQEWAIIGAPCGRIQQLAQQLIRQMEDYYPLAYVDADHAAGDAAEQMAPSGAAVSMLDKINFHRYDFGDTLNAFQRRPLFAGVDGVLVNGNHFRARRQIVILDPKKAESLSRKLDRLTGVALILTTDEQSTPYDFLREHLGEQLPQLMPLGDINGISQWLRAQLTAARPPLYGLVLAGGKSQRMGADKAELAYHGKPQWQHAADLLQPHCEEVFVSVREARQRPGHFPEIVDAFAGLGPYGAILSAFREKPDAAWLVVACDLPLLNSEGLAQLVKKRQSSQLATAFHNPATGWPDPLLTIWEPRAYPAMLQFLAQGYSCPRKVLINSPIAEIPVPEEVPQLLENANTPEERAAVLARLEGTK
jgi:molybdopterin-guanine dinucleotide biosynthesis protein A